MNHPLRLLRLLAALILPIPAVLHAANDDRQTFTNAVVATRDSLQTTAARLDILSIPCLTATNWTALASAAIAQSHRPDLWRDAFTRSANPAIRRTAQARILQTLQDPQIKAEAAAFELRTGRSLSTLTPAELLALRNRSPRYTIPARP